MRLGAPLTAIFASLLVLLTLVANAAADDPSATAQVQVTPRPTTLFLDTFTLSPDVGYDQNNFWCEFNNYGSFFANYSGQCPYQNYVATVHWKKVPNVTEYDICVKPAFRGSGPGFVCFVIQPPKSGSPAALSMTFDSAAMFLNAYQGTTQVWMVKACNFDPAPPFGSCSESNTVSAEIPWTG
jgi:hypothetical protein